MDFDRLKRISHILSLLNQESHSDRCRVDGLGDGLPCCCGYSDAFLGLSQLINEEVGTELEFVNTNEFL